MITTHQLVGACWIALLSGVLQLGGAGQAAAQRTKGPTGKPGTVAPTAPTPPSGSAEARAVTAALRTTLGKSTVRNAVRAEVIRQLRANAPVALVNGYWVTVVNLGAVYALPTVRPGLLATLGATGPQLVSAASTSPSGLTLVFTNAQLGKLLMPDFAADFTSSMGVAAAQTHMTDVWGLVGDALGGMGVLIDGAQGVTGFVRGLVQAAEDWANGDGEYDPNADIDGDGIANWKDDDDDGDGVTDQNDNYPADPSKSICDCGRGRGVAFGTSFPAGFLGSVVSIIGSPQLQAGRISLGAAIAGQTRPVAIVF